MALHLPLPSVIREMGLKESEESARRAGRLVWAGDDYDAGVRLQDRLVAECYGHGTEAVLKWMTAERLEAAGLLQPKMPVRDFWTLVEGAMKP